MTTLEMYNALKRRLDEIERRREQNVGALDQLLKRLKQEFGCASLQEAKIKLKRLTREQQEKQAEFDRLFTKFYRKHQALLEEGEKEG